MVNLLSSYGPLPYGTDFALPLYIKIIFIFYSVHCAGLERALAGRDRPETAFHLFTDGHDVQWRPTNNNQRYAFTPLLDSDDETEDDDVVVHDNLGNLRFVC